MYLLEPETADQFERGMKTDAADVRQLVPTGQSQAGQPPAAGATMTIFTLVKCDNIKSNVPNHVFQRFSFY